MFHAVSSNREQESTPNRPVLLGVSEKLELFVAKT